MKQVELALKEKSGVKNKYGVNLATSLFGKGKGIKLRVPFGDNLQDQAEYLFVGAFSYYRNYSAHNGSEINNISCPRILVIASELLDLIGASDISFADVGGIPGLIHTGVFNSNSQVYNLLNCLEDNVLTDHVCDGFYEELAYKGLSESHVQAVIETGLVEYITEPYIPSAMDKHVVYIPDELGCFQLTTLGKEVLTS